MLHSLAEQKYKSVYSDVSSQTYCDNEYMYVSVHLVSRGVASQNLYKMMTLAMLPVLNFLEIELRSTGNACSWHVYVAIWYLDKEKDI